ncbi:MAG: FtsW/RodA/SpoVE family cell cycle protein [Eubacteriales bacterium]|nr:FtsW/RodA/SpoVE family cell cycle protein [Eubacteriales bacterium]
MFRTFSFRKFDYLLVFLVAALSYCGLLAIQNAAPELYDRQLKGLYIGLVTMLIVSTIDYHLILKIYWLYYIAAIALLALVLYVGSSGGGAQRWITLFGVTFQPSEGAKLLLILFFSQFIIDCRKRLPLIFHLLLCTVLALPPVYLIYKEPDLSTSLILILIFCVLMYVGGLEWPVVVCALAAAVPSMIWVIRTALLGGEQSILSEYQRNRILAWFHPEEFADTTAYQTMNSMMAIGSGGLYGKADNRVSSFLKTGFISESQTDFIFTVIGETFGFIGCCAVVVLIFLITTKCFLIAARAKDVPGRIIAAGMGAWIGLQSFMNIGVATGLLPNTGIPLPFVSYGLTSLVCLYAGLGFLINVRMQE